MDWKTIEGYEGYEVSNTGIVRGVDRFVDMPNGKKRLAKGCILKTRVTKHGYVDVRLSRGSTPKTYLVHRLVAQAFIPNPDGLPQVNHLSGNKLDNSVENLAWTDASGNVLHAYKQGLNNQCGCSHSNAVIVINLITGELYCTQKELSEHLGVNYKSLSEALNGQRPFPKSWDLSGHSYQKYSC